MEGLLNFLLSLRTAIWLLLGLLFFLLIGAFIMPVREEFSSINTLPLFVWLRHNPFSATWWLFGSILALALLTANTVVCSIESLLRKRQKRQWLLIISPQVIHMGFLFMLLAHLLSSIGSSRVNTAAYEGSAFELPNGIILRVKAIEMTIGPEGHPLDWQADIEYFSDNTKLKEDSLGPNRPSFYRGLGVYLKDIRVYPIKAILLEVSREPGAVWALIGGILFTAGTVTLIALKIGREEIL